MMQSARHRLRIDRAIDVMYTFSSPALVAEYKYIGLGFRIGWHYDADADGTVENTTDDPWFLFVYDERWRIVNTYRLADWLYSVSNPAAASSKERFVYHNAGLGGVGGSSYIDAVILRDRDMNTSWTAASDGTLEKRHYYCQNWRADVSAIIDSSGKMVEWVKYSAYGVPLSLPSGDTDSDLDWDATDSAAMTGSYDVRKDADLDGDVDAADATHANSIKPGTGYQTLGRGVQSSTGVENRKSYAGYEYDPTFKGAGRVIYHCRYRSLDADLGRWLRRDPTIYLDGISLYSYAMARVLTAVDPFGLACQRAQGCAGNGQPQIPPPPNGADCVASSTTLEECLDCCTQDGQTNLACADACFWVYINPRPIRRPPPGEDPCNISDNPGWSDEEACENFNAQCPQKFGGGVICRNGRPVSCVFIPDPPPGDVGRPGWGIIYDCMTLPTIR